MEWNETALAAAVDAVPQHLFQDAAAPFQDGQPGVSPFQDGQPGMSLFQVGQPGVSPFQNSTYRVSFQQVLIQVSLEQTVDWCSVHHQPCHCPRCVLATVKSLPSEAAAAAAAAAAGLRECGMWPRPYGCFSLSGPSASDMWLSTSSTDCGGNTSQG